MSSPKRNRLPETFIAGLDSETLTIKKLIPVEVVEDVQGYLATFVAARLSARAAALPAAVAALEARIVAEFLRLEGLHDSILDADARAMKRVLGEHLGRV